MSYKFNSSKETIQQIVERVQRDSRSKTTLEVQHLLMSLDKKSPYQKAKDVEAFDEVKVERVPVSSARGQITKRLACIEDEIDSLIEESKLKR